MSLLSISSLVNVLPSRVANALNVMKAFYSEGMAHDSFEVINGQLDGVNLKETKPLGISQIKQNALANGRMIGLTGNLDYFGRTFPRSVDDAGAYTAIPGASQEFFLPHDCSLVIFTWMVTATNTLDYNVSGPVDTDDGNLLRFVLDGVYQPNTERTLALGQDTTTAGNPVQHHRARLWSGHHIEQTMAQGWHSAQIEIFINADMSRVRIRNMKVLWFK